MKKKFFSVVILVYITGALSFLAAIAYLGTFTRYMADDYCETYNTQTYSPLRAVINRYEEGSWRAANRYSNLLFVGVVESLAGWKSIEIVPVVMIILWTIGLFYLVRQVRKLAGIKWHTLLDIFLGMTLAFLSILQAPNRFQTFYWRSSMATHFVPLVFLNFLVVLLLYRMRTKRESLPSVWTILALLFVTFMIGGFSEPPLTVMIVGAGLGLAYIWFFIKDETRHPLLALVACVFTGSVSALIVMAVSPAATNLGETTPSFFEWIQRTVQYTYFFVIDTFKALPIPILFSIVCPAIFFFAVFRGRENSIVINGQANRNIALALPVILVLLIAAGFSTSAYGQSYPVERARFFAHYLMTIVLVFEGALLGIWVSQAKIKFFNARYFAHVPGLILLMMAFYPFRAGLQGIQETPEYSIREQEWERRNAHIYKLREQGQTDITVPQFNGVQGVKELDSSETHWVNRCAARYYQINSIRAIPIFEDEIEAYYGN